ncbi:MAG TPA: YbbR-like domain-containing protein [Candidatus Bacteroides merdigallinarum]|uniref:YbbR-like domain-containing protein n=1 Tax=Candidatus Bacteroides merdigallinarum TaxID=2838473 RepID=A0A9D2E807_9BACE|nr:YbbR-like domain-containing protein [Candidatus Bacteroides merdigallinarum]
MFDRRNIRQIYARISKQLKDFLLSEKSREFFIFLFFFFVAGGFWLLQTLNNDYETEFSVPVRLRKVPENVVITSEPVSKLQVRVKDKGTALLNYMLGKSFYPVTIDFPDYKGKNNRVRIYASNFSKEIAGQLKASTQLLSIKPDTLEYIFSTGVSKKVPVKLQGDVKAGRQYYFPDTLFQPDSVLVYAPETMLDTIQAAYTQYLTLDEVADTVTRHLSLQAGKGVKFVPSTTQMTLPVDIYTEKTVEVPLRGINFPADKVLRAFPSKVQVTFQVGVSQFRQITAEDFHINVSYEELLDLGNNKYTVKLRSIPKGVNHVRFNPEQVDFLIEQVSPGYGY